ncbi:hypothetical protein [Polluticoccus soli]|uniref:hypothetical protein n=1 Tax=Polluticoccus soli TaxID=3034150 RepID=UPI0023E1041A|nr:hypothetical protein [Flavipsychrobacter sp. JY13-12]
MSESITLNYIDKLHQSLQSVGQALHLSIKWNFFICLFLLLIFLGEVTPASKISIEGFDIEFSLTLLTMALSCIITWMLVQILGLSIQESDIRDSIIRLYASISFSDDSLNDNNASPLEYPSYLTIPFRPRAYGKSAKAILYSNVLLILATLFIFVLPIVTQIVVLVKLFASQGVKWWIIAVLIPLICISIITVVTFVRELLR